MASTPKKRQLEKMIEAKGGADYIIKRMSEVSQTVIAEEFGTTRPMITNYIRRRTPPEVRENAVAVREENRRLARLDPVGGIEGALQKIADGGTLDTVAAELGMVRNTLSNTIKEYGKPGDIDRAYKWRARKYIDDTINIADEVDGDSASQVQKAKLRIQSRQWVAARDDRETFGNDAPTVAVNIGELFLQAVTARNNEILVEPSPETVGE